MVTTTLEGLRTKETELKEKERELAAQYRSVNDFSPDGAKRRDSLRRELGEVTAELTSIWPKVAAAKEAAKKARLADLLTSAQYRQEVADGLETLAAELSGWLPLLTTTVAATRDNLHVPLPPASKSALYLEGKAWINLLVRRNIIAAKDVPPALKGLLEVS